MHCRNVSLRGICATLNETYGIKTCPQTIENYLGRYEKLLSDYMNDLKPKFSGHVNVDELWIKIDGQIKYLFAALDPNTRFLLCTILSQKKDHKGARKLFHRLAEVT
jgi:transposase-like protein